MRILAEHLQEELCSGEPTLRRQREQSRAVFSEQSASVSQMQRPDYWIHSPVTEANDAVSAHTHVRVSETPRLLRFLRRANPHIWIRLRPSECQSIGIIDEPAATWERRLEEVVLENNWKRGTLGMSSFPFETRFFCVRERDTNGWQVWDLFGNSQGHLIWRIQHFSVQF